MGNKNNRLVLLIACGLTLMLVFSWLTPTSLAVDAEEAKSAIDQAERDLGAAYTAVVEASNAGADINPQLTKLTEAGNYLSEAQAAFKEGAFEKAIQGSQDCRNTVSDVLDDAARLKEEAKTASSDRLILTSAASGVGLAVFIVAAFFGWRFLKRRYTQKLLGMKPVLEETR